MKAFWGSLVGLLSEQVQVRGYITLKITYSVRDDSKEIKFNYLIMDTLSPYNAILGKPPMYSLWAIISTKYLVQKYILPNGWVRTVQGDQENILECHQSSLSIGNMDLSHNFIPFLEPYDTHTASWDPRMGMDNEILMPTEDLKEV